MKTWPHNKLELRILAITEGGGRKERMSPTYKQYMKKLRKIMKKIDRKEAGQRSWLRPR